MRKRRLEDAKGDVPNGASNRHKENSALPKMTSAAPKSTPDTTSGSKANKDNGRVKEVDKEGREGESFLIEEDILDEGKFKKPAVPPKSKGTKPKEVQSPVPDDILKKAGANPSKKHSSVSISPTLEDLSNEKILEYTVLGHKFPGGGEPLPCEICGQPMAGDRKTLNDHLVSSHRINLIQYYKFFHDRTNWTAAHYYKCKECTGAPFETTSTDKVPFSSQNLKSDPCTMCLTHVLHV